VLTEGLSPTELTLASKLPPSIADRLNGRDNNIKLIRMVAASLVILGHSFSVSRGPSFVAWPAPILPFSFGTLAVDIFFTLSGFLITKSYVERGDLAAFLRARALRIYPAGVTAVLVTALGFGLAFTTLDPSSYLRNHDTWSYVTRNIHLTMAPIRMTLPGVFTANPTPSAVNDPLWTLPYEVWMYGFAAFAGVVGLLGRRVLFNVAAACLIAGYWVINCAAPTALEGPALTPFWRLAFFFLFGATAYVNRDAVPLRFSIFAAGVVICFLTFGSAWYRLWVSVTLAYGTLHAAFTPAEWLRRYNRFGDFSYGLYVFGFPIQQVVAAIAPGIMPYPLFAASMSLGLPVAMLSWWYIEEPALRFKDGSRSRRLS
jgi:peptidoglycan/LPS O-acetylase OafA/YrhL